jgi:hypothetical protein
MLILEVGERAVVVVVVDVVDIDCQSLSWQG